MLKRRYDLEGELWIYPTERGAWRFLSVPKKESKEINNNFNHLKRGWGSFPVLVKIGKTEWNTSIFPDKKSETYLLPVKAIVRKRENIREGEEVKFSIEILI